MKEQYPYKECELCKDLGDCAHPDISDNFMGTPLPPDDCPRSVEIMKNTNKKHKRYDRDIN